MKKYSFIFYYLVFLVLGFLSIYSFYFYKNLNFGYSRLFGVKQEVVRDVKTSIVSIAMSDRIGNIKYFTEEIEYDGNIDNLAHSALEILFEATKNNRYNITGSINPEAEFLGLTYDNKNYCAFVKVSPNFTEGRTTRQRQIAKKQIKSTLNDVYRDIEDCVFIINGKEVAY